MEGESPFEWPPLESNPEIFTEYLHSVGLTPDWIIAECYGLEEDTLQFVPKPTIAVIATFENLDKSGESRKVGDLSVSIPFYMKQTGKLDNACGVIACIHSVLNNLDKLELK